MAPTNEARRPARRTARPKYESLPGTPAFYADSLAHSILDGHATEVRCKPYRLAAFGNIGPSCDPMRPVVIDTRAIVGAPESVRRDGGFERSVVTIHRGRGRLVRVALDVAREVLEAAIRKARR